MAWIEPLELETWFIRVFSGSPEIFSIVALILIAGMSAYFRMNGIAMFFMLGLFVFLFSAWIGNTFLILIAIIGGLLIGYWISKLVKG